MKVFITIVALLMSMQLSAADSTANKRTSLVKLDLFNLIGSGINKANISYETAAFRPHKYYTSSLQLDLSIPFNSIDEFDVNFGTEGTVQLRTYVTTSWEEHSLTGLYFSLGLQAGWMTFQRDTRYRHMDDPSVFRDHSTTYDRYRTGVFGMIGGQSQLTDRLFIDGFIGLGLTNNRVVKRPSTIGDDFIVDDWFWIDNPLFYSFEEGNYLFPMLPIGFSIGYKL